MNDEIDPKKQISALSLINAFLRSDIKESQELDTVAAALLQAIAGYIGMSSKRICYAKRDALMYITKIKSTSTYTAAIERLKKLNLIKSSKKWKLVSYEFGKNIILFEKTKNILSSSVNELDISVKNPSSSRDEQDQVRETNTTIEIENYIINNNRALNGIRNESKKISINKKEDEMDKNKTMDGYDQYVKMFSYMGDTKNESYKKLSATEAYNANFRARYHEAVRLQEFRNPSNITYCERSNL